MAELTLEEQRARAEKIGVARFRAELISQGRAAPIEPVRSYAEQVEAAFRQENLFVAGMSALFSHERNFGVTPGFDPAARLGSYARYTEQFPELLQARSEAELAYRKMRIDREARDRRTLEGMGFWRGLAVYGPAGLLSPENALPIGTALRTAMLARTLGKATLKAVGARALEGAAEAAGSQLAAEAALQPLQGFRTTEEGILNVVGAGLFGTVLGGAAGGIALGRSKALKKLTGLETTGEIVEARNRAMAKVLDPTTEIGAKLGEDLERYVEKGEEVAGADKPIEDLTIFEDSPAVMAYGADNPVGARFLEQLQKDNPELARLVGSENRISRSLFRALVFMPSMRLAASDIATTRLLGQLLTGHYIREDGGAGTGGLSVEGAINLFDAGTRRIQIEQSRIADDLFRGALRDIDEDRAWEMVGEARKRGDKASEVPSFRQGQEYDPFAEIRGNKDAIAGIEKLAALHREFSELVLRTATISGTYTPGPMKVGRIDEIMAGLDMEHLSRVIDQEWVRANPAAFRANIKRGLLARIPVVKPEIEAERAELLSKLEAAEDPIDVDYYKQQVKYADEALAKLDEDGVDDLAYSIESNYRPHAPGTGVAQQNPFMARVLQIDDRYLGDALIKDVRVLQNRMIRSILPDLVLAERMDAKLGNTPLQRELAKTLEEIDSKVEKAREEGLTSDKADAVLADMADALDKAAELKLISNSRLLRGGDVDLPAIHQEIKDAFELRTRERARRVTLRKQLRVLQQEIAAWKEIGEDVVELEAKATLVRAGIAESRALSDAATAPVDRIAKRIANNVGNEAAHKGRLTMSELAPRRGDQSLEGAATPEQLQRRLDTVNRMVHAEVASARLDTYRINVGTEHVKKAIERGHLRVNPTPDRKATRRMEREQEAAETEILRLRNKHGLTEGDAAEWARRVRDFSYMTKMGSVLLSSIPDLAMAISTAGFVPYATALGKNLRTIIDGKIPKNSLAEVIYATNRTGAILRSEKMYGVDDEMVPRNRLDRGLAVAREKFTVLTGIRRWNAFNRAVAAQAIESRIVKTILQGENATKQDRTLIRFFGISDEDLPDMKKLLERTHTKDGALLGDFFFANANRWRSEYPEMSDFKTSRLRNLRLEIDGAILKGVHDTIIEPSAGDLPTFATKHPLGKALFQFRAFSFAAMNRFLLPGLQRTAGRDSRPAAAAAMATLFGMFVYAVSDYIKGKDPFREEVDKDGNPLSWEKRWAWEGVDRGGALGILTEAASSVDKIMGFGLLDSSRFQSRAKADAFFGPSAGVGVDLIDALGTFSDGDVTNAEVSRIRRLIPYQNLLILRAFLDLGPNLPRAGSPYYFDDFKKIDQRVAEALGADLQ